MQAMHGIVSKWLNILSTVQHIYQFTVFGGLQLEPAELVKAGENIWGMSLSLKLNSSLTDFDSEFFEPSVLGGLWQWRFIASDLQLADIESSEGLQDQVNVIDLDLPLDKYEQDLISFIAAHVDGIYKDMVFFDSENQLLDDEWLVAADKSKNEIERLVGKWVKSFIINNRGYADWAKASHLELMLPRCIQAILEGVCGTSNMPWHYVWLLLTPKFLLHLLREVWIPIDHGVSLIAHWFFPSQANFFTDCATDNKTVILWSSSERIADSLCYSYYKSSLTVYDEAELKAGTVKIEQQQLDSLQDALSSGLSNLELAIGDKMHQIAVLVVQHHNTLMEIDKEVGQIEDEKGRMKDENIRPMTSGESWLI